jgi:hypothetical protein
LVAIRCECGKRLAEVSVARDEASKRDASLSARLQGAWFAKLFDGVEERNAKGIVGVVVEVEDWWQVTCQSARCRRVYRGRADTLVALVKSARDNGEPLVLRSGAAYGFDASVD